MNNNLDIEELIRKQGQIRRFFISKIMSPQYFCSYLSFSKVFPSPSVYDAYTSQNLDIIDCHLRFHQNIFEEMMPYKWVPIVAIALVTRLNTFSLVFPLIYTNLFDLYFRKYFIWTHRNDKNINIRRQFITKLSKNKNILRRVTLFSRIKDELGITEEDIAKNNTIQTTQNIFGDKLFQKLSGYSPEMITQNIPQKYIKFGESTPFVFHTTFRQQKSNQYYEESQVYLTNFFELYMKSKTNFSQIITDFFTSIKNFPKNYTQFRKDYKNNKQLYDKRLFMQPSKFLEYKQIKKQQIYSETNRIENRLRRFLQTAKYHLTGQLAMNGFTFADWTNFNKHYDLRDKQRFNLENNKADLTIFYSLIALPAILRMIFKRKTGM